MLSRYQTSNTSKVTLVALYKHNILLWINSIDLTWVILLLYDKLEQIFVSRGKIFHKHQSNQYMNNQNRVF